MPAGFQCFNASGVLTFEALDYIGRVLGRIAIVGANGPGSIVDAGLLAGTPFGIFFLTSVSTGLNTYKTVTITINGSTLSWTFVDGSTAGNSPDGFIIYGLK
ncbi:hypothetical protein [Massilia sp. TSP1-1-2]|uniref:hypothetical protein n=1 Tax=Massilia sp. TSP1-1-2 TaxID=2804649 RepID=UPI003CED96A9